MRSNAIKKVAHFLSVCLLFYADIEFMVALPRVMRKQAHISLLLAMVLPLKLSCHQRIVVHLQFYLYMA